MKQFTSFLTLACLITLVACQGSENNPTVTPPVAPIATPTMSPTDEPTAVPPTPIPPTPTIPPATTEPTAPTALPTATTASPTAEPTAAPIPITSIQLEPVLTGGLFRPVYLTHAGDDRLFVVEQMGTIRIIAGGQLLTSPFLDIQDRVGSTANEQGLLSVAFHPDYQVNGRFFVNYTNNNGDTVIARYQVSAAPNQADPNSEIILLTIPQPYGNHNGGQLQFGPDGYLYVGMGDGGSAGDPHGHGQNPGTLLGALLRLDVNTDENSYTIPANNPFVGQNDRRAEIWAYGLRNPWRFSFDRLTGDLYIADVGQNQWEEVSFQPAESGGGENYGWNVMEGAHCFSQTGCDQSGLVLPIFEYSHNEGGCSVTGGYVYRGQQFPSLTGNYFVADYCSGFIWALVRQADGVWVTNQVLQSGLIISSFGEDVTGELYVVNHSGGIYRLRP